MNQGGEPAHDDYGLPRVDIEIPDDARELDRDVQAYHRELRALRRIERSDRWRAPLRKSGMLVPLIAGCLVLAMIGGMVLTMFSANPNIAGVAGRESLPATSRPSHVTGQTSASPGGSASASTRAQSPAGSVPASAAAANVLPAGLISAGNRKVRLRSLITAAIAIIPANCHCATVIGRLVARAQIAKVKVYLVGLNGSTVRDLRQEAPPLEATSAVLAIDVNNVLASSYRPIARLTVLLVDRHRHLRRVRGLGNDVQIDRALRALK